MTTPRPRDAAGTRAAILAAARTQFAELGFDRTTLRAVARAAGCDPVMVYRYFGNKQELFVQAVSLELQLPDLASLPREHVVAAMFDHFFKVWEDDPTFIGLLRASAGSEEAVDAMKSFFMGGVLPQLKAVALDGALERVALAGSFVIGLAWSRYVLKNPPLTMLSREAFLQLARPAFEVVLFGATLGPA